MTMHRIHLPGACATALLLLAACGGEPGMRSDVGGTASAVAVGADEAGGAPRAESWAVAPAQRSALVHAMLSTPAEGPPRLDPDGIPASDIEASLARYENAFQDETSCWAKDDPCDGDYAIELNRKSSGMVGWWSKTGRDVFVDREDFVRLPQLAGAMTVFVKSNPASNDWLDVTLEDRAGTRLYAFAPLGAGTSAAISWTRTDDRIAGPYRLRLSARTGPGDHTVSYTVLPVARAQWLAQAQGQPAR